MSLFQVLSEYEEVMANVAECLDELQGEAKAYLGILLPTLHIMKQKLERIRDRRTLTFARPLVDALIRNYQKRFGHLYDDLGILMASATHPHYTPKVVDVLAPDRVLEVREKILRKLVVL